MSELSLLRWRCRRGMKELDVLLERYLTRDYPSASEKDRQVFRNLLDMQDPELMSYLMGRDAPTDMDTARVIQAIQRPD